VQAATDGVYKMGYPISVLDFIFCYRGDKTSYMIDWKFQ